MERVSNGTGPPSPSRHGRLACNSCCCYEIGGLPRVKFIFLKGLLINSSFPKDLACVPVYGRLCTDSHPNLRARCALKNENATAWVTFVLSLSILRVANWI